MCAEKRKKGMIAIDARVLKNKYNRNNVSMRWATRRLQNDILECCETAIDYSYRRHRYATQAQRRVIYA